MKYTHFVVHTNNSKYNKQIIKLFFVRIFNYKKKTKINWEQNWKPAVRFLAQIGHDSINLNLFFVDVPSAYIVILFIRFSDNQLAVESNKQTKNQINRYTFRFNSEFKVKTTKKMIIPAVPAAGLGMCLII